MKNSRSPYVIVGALLASASLAVTAQAPLPEPAKPAAQAKPKAPVKPAAPKAEPKKDEKKAAPRKTAPKADAAKKTEAKKPAVAPPKKPLEIKTMNTDKPLVLRDKDGKVIPTTPDAYNVDSALPKKR